MTTIVYDHKNKQIACDSRLTQGSAIITDEAIKYVNISDRLWFFSGNESEKDLFISTFEEGGETKIGNRNQAIVIVNKVAYRYYIDEGKFFKVEIKWNDGIGSGCEYALSGIDFGESVEGAVNYSASKDVYSGGKVHVYDIELGEFLDDK